MPRITALLLLRSTMKTVSAPASRSFRGSLPHPTHPLCTLRVRRHRRLTQHSLPGGLLGLTWAGLSPADRASLSWRLPSFDHLVGSGEQRGWHGEAKCPSGSKIDDQFKCRRLLERQLRRLCTPQNFVHIASCTSKLLTQIDSVTHQPSVLRVFPKRIYGRELRRHRKLR